MPEPPRKREPKKKFMKRCISHIVKKEGKPRKEASAICHSMWRRKKMEEENESNKRKEFILTVPMITKSVILQTGGSETGIVFTPNRDTATGDRRAVAIVGDKFYKGNFLPAKELEKIYKHWNGTLHDINHMGTTSVQGFHITSDVRFFVGYQKNAAYDSKTKEVSMDIHVKEGTLYGEAWRNYVDLCEEAGLIPNVSIAFTADLKMVKVKDLPKGVKYSDDKPEEDAVIPYIYNIEPQALSTVFKGACSDKDGCGIKKHCEAGKCDLPDEIYEKRKQEIIDRLIKEDKKNE